MMFLTRISLVFLLCSTLSHAQHEPMEPSRFIQVLSRLLQDQHLTIFKPYSLDIFSPLGGPYFEPIWKLGAPYNVHFHLGFPDRSGPVSDQLDPKLSKNSILIFHDYNLSETRSFELSADLPIYDLMLDVFTSFEEAKYSHVLHRFDCGVKNIEDKNERARMQEATRPRYYFKFALDLYRFLLHSEEQCLGKGFTNCARPFRDYTQVLWVYSWVACSITGHLDAFDVDYICPRLCRPHPLWVLRGEHGPVDGPHLLYKDDPDPYAADLCKQLANAVAGSCHVTDRLRSITPKELRCQCMSSAYEWTVRDGYRGCHLKSFLIKNATMITPRIWRVRCPGISLCSQIGTEACFHLVERHRPTTDPIMYSTELVTLSETSYCRCKTGFTGATCNVKFNACEHPIRGAISKKENYMYANWPEGIYLPFYDMDDYAAASGNWLCGLQDNRGKCELNSVAKGGFSCICARGYGRDEHYSPFDNCIKEVLTENITEIDGHEVVICGSNVCLNNGTCVVKPATDLLFNSLSGGEVRIPELDMTRVCKCADGFFGSSCELEANEWAEWEAWSPCMPSCGQFRYRYRMRSCIGDAGCLGSALQSNPCDYTECPLLKHVQAASSKQPDMFGNEGRYYSISRENLLIWMLGLLVPLEIFLIALGVVILERCILRGHM